MRSEKRKFGVKQVQNLLDSLIYENNEYTTIEKKQIYMDLYNEYLKKIKIEKNESNN